MNDQVFQFKGGTGQEPQMHRTDFNISTKRRANRAQYLFLQLRCRWPQNKKYRHQQANRNHYTLGTKSFQCTTIKVLRQRV